MAGNYHFCRTHRRSSSESQHSCCVGVASKTGGRHPRTPKDWLLGASGVGTPEPPVGSVPPDEPSVDSLHSGAGAPETPKARVADCISGGRHPRAPNRTCTAGQAGGGVAAPGGRRPQTPEDWLCRVRPGVGTPGPPFGSVPPGEPAVESLHLVAGAPRPPRAGFVG